MWLKPAMARPVIAMLLLVLVVAASSCNENGSQRNLAKTGLPNLSWRMLSH